MSTRWTEADTALLLELYPSLPAHEVAARMGKSISSIYSHAQELRISKSPEFLQSKASGRTSGEQGKATRFAKGQAPWNKGKSYIAGGRSGLTQFRKGERTGKAAELWRPIGHERVCDGYLQRKVTDTGVTRHDYRQVHRLIWEEVHGPIPPGHALAFRNGDRADIRLDNLELISRRELMLRNTVHKLPKEVVEVIQLRGALRRKIKNRERQHEEQNAARS